MVGTGQKGCTLYDRVFNHFKAARPATNRSAGSLEARWRDISKYVGKYCGHLAQCNAHPRSGENSDDQESRALQLYVDEFHEAFDLMHCYKLLHKSPKWAETVVEDNRRAARRVANAAGRASRRTASAKAVDEDDIAEEEPVEDPRPGERKAAKEAAKVAQSNEAIAADLVDRQRGLLKQQKMRNKQMAAYMKFEKMKFRKWIQLESGMLRMKKLRYGTATDNNDEDDKDSEDDDSLDDQDDEDNDN